MHNCIWHESCLLRTGRAHCSLSDGANSAQSIFGDIKDVKDVEFSYILNQYAVPV